MKVTSNEIYRNIAVIGAGPSGLAACKYLKGAGFNVTVFEKSKKIGGTWNTDKGFPGLSAQSINKAYTFTDYYYRPGVSLFPTHQEVYDYLVGYANHFNLMNHILLNNEVISMQKADKQHGWHITIANSSKTYTQHFDFVIVSNGAFNQPYCPNIENKNEFKGKIMHAVDFTSLNMLEGDNVIVVGAGKTGLHLATYIAAKTKKKVSLVYKNSRMILPLRYMNIIPFYYLFFRPFRSIKRPYDKLPFHENLVYQLFRPLNYMMQAAEGFLAQRQLGLLNKKLEGLAKAKSIGCGTMLEPDYYQESINQIELYPDAQIHSYTANGVILNNDCLLKAATIIFSTGYKQNTDFLLEKNIMDENQRIWLYKHVLHPELPDLAFNCHVIGLNSILNAEIATQWIIHYLLGDIEIPSISEMHFAIEKQKQYYLSSGFDATALASCVTPNDYFWIKDMLKDMGKMKKKKFGNVFTEYLFDGHAKDYHHTKLRISK